MATSVQFVQFPYWFLLSNVGVNVDQQPGFAYPSDGYGVYTVAQGADLCIVLFSAERLAHEFVGRHTIQRVMVAEISEMSQLQDLSQRCNESCSHYILDPDGYMHGKVSIADVLKLNS